MAQERGRVSKLTTEMITLKEQMEETTAAFKDASRRLKKADIDVGTLTVARDEYKEKAVELELGFGKCKIDLKEFVHKETLASENSTEYMESNAKSRALWTSHEQNAADFRVEVTELKKKLEVMKGGNDRLSEENQAYKKQNAALVDQLKENQESDEQQFKIEMTNKNMVSDPDLTPRTLERRYNTLREDFAEKKKSWSRENKQQNQLLAFSKDANVRIKEDYEILEERYKRHQQANDNLVAELRDEVKSV